LFSFDFPVFPASRSLGSYNRREEIAGSAL
jgi:hypothetical protein